MTRTVSNTGNTPVIPAAAGRTRMALQNNSPEAMYVNIFAPVDQGDPDKTGLKLEPLGGFMFFQDNGTAILWAVTESGAPRPLTIITDAV